MIDRYTRAQMGEIWSEASRFQSMLDIEKAVAQVQGQRGLIPKEAAEQIVQKGCFQIERIQEIELRTKHDTIAFVSNVAENIGEPHGRYVHFGLTSSDVVDSALSVLIKKSSDHLRPVLEAYQSQLLQLIKDHRETLCSGRTHGMHAEPTTFGYKLAGFHAEFKRAQARLDQALNQAQVVKLSGAVGTYSTLESSLETEVAALLGFSSETVATQVIPRDRHADVIYALSMMMSHLERLAIELRHLQRTEVSEVTEGFQPGQKGSSAMPHKKNPISSENISGLARLMRGYVTAAMENIPLWHERDISHSSVERVIFPDSFILVDYALDRMTGVLSRLYVDKERMLKNMSFSQGQLFSSHVLIALVEQGLSRERAYEIVQSVSHAMKPGETLQSALEKSSEVNGMLSAEVLKRIFSGATHLKGIKDKMTDYLAQTSKDGGLK